MGIHVIRFCAFGHFDRHTSSGGHNVFDEERRLRHHRPPPCLVPANRAILKDHLEMAVVIHIGVYVIGKTQPHASHLHGFGIRDLTHHVHVVNPAIDYR